MRRFLIYVSLLAPSLAAAAPVFTPGGGIASSRNNPTYEIRQDGIARFSNVDPATMLGGQPISTVLSQMGQNTQGLATEIARAQSAEAQAVKQDDIGATVAGLDANASVANAFSGASDLLGRWQDKLSTRPWFNLFSHGFDSELVGGIATRPDGTYIPRSLLITSDPYGPYAAGCGVGVSMTGTLAAPQYPVSQKDPNGGAASVVGTGQYETVANCALLSNRPARLVLSVAGYTATSVILKTPLTASQAAQIVPNEYITTNSPNLGLSLPSVSGQLPPKNLYAGFVAAQPTAGDTTIAIHAWSVPGYGSTTDGQIPQTTTLDTVWSAYKTPVVFIGGGAGSAAFAQNWFFGVNADDLAPSDHNASLIHQLTPLEIDLSINGTAPPKSIWWQGITMNAGLQPGALTDNSQQFYMGGDINHHLVVDGGVGNWDIEANGFYVPVAHNGIGQVGHAGTVTSQLSAVWEQWIEGSNRLQVRLYDTTSNTSAPVGWQQAVVHLGPTVDGNPVQTGDMGGSAQGEIQWNEGAYYGGISLCGYGAFCGATMLGNGHLLIRPGQDSATQLVFNPPGNGGNPYITASDATDLRVSNSLGSGVIFSTYETDVTNVRAKTYVDLLAGASIIGRTAANGVAGTLTPDVSGNWTFGTQVSGGANVSGINILDAESLNLSSSSYAASTGKFTGQGTSFLWNQLNSGNALTELVNVDPGSSGGFKFYDITNGTAATSSNALALLDGSGFHDYHTLTVDGASTLTGAVSIGGRLSALDASLSGRLSAATVAANNYQLSSATYTSGTGRFSGQGGIWLWNTLNSGAAYTEFVNVDPGTSGGFLFRNVTTGNTASDSNRIALLNGSGILDYEDLTVGGVINSAGGLFFNNPNHANAFYLTLSSDGKTLQAGTQVSGGGNVSGINVLTASHVVETATYTLSTLPTGAQDGERAWCSDCKLNSVAGVEAHWHASNSKWLDSQNNKLAN